VRSSLRVTVSLRWGEREKDPFISLVPTTNSWCICWLDRIALTSSRKPLPLCCTYRCAPHAIWNVMGGVGVGLVVMIPWCMLLAQTGHWLTDWPIGRQAGRQSVGAKPLSVDLSYHQIDPTNVCDNLFVSWCISVYSFVCCSRAVVAAAMFWKGSVQFCILFHKSISIDQSVDRSEVETNHIWLSRNICSYCGCR